MVFLEIELLCLCHLSCSFPPLDGPHVLDFWVSTSAVHLNLASFIPVVLSVLDVSNEDGSASLSHLKVGLNPTFHDVHVRDGLVPFECFLSIQKNQ